MKRRVAALHGVRSGDIDDDEIRALWAEMERLYVAITPIATRISTRLAQPT